MRSVAEQDSAITIEDRPQPAPELVRLLEQVRWGSQGVRYVSHDVAEQLAWIGDGHYLHLRCGGELAATMVVVAKRPRQGIHSYYRTMLAVDERFTGRGLGAAIAHYARQHFLDQAAEPTVLYGFVDTANAPSMRIAERLGYQHLAELCAVDLGYVAPGDDHRVGRLGTAERAELLHRIVDTRPATPLDDVADALRTDEYWVLRAGGEIVAGAQACIKRMTITALPGWRGQLMLRAAPLLGWLHSALRSRRRAYVQLGNLYARRGADDALRPLIAAVLRRHGTTLALTYLDRRDPMLHRLRDARALGPLHGLAGASTIAVMAAARGVSPSVLESLRRGPWPVSALDRM